MENNNLYVNAVELISLIECMQLAAVNSQAYAMAEEIQGLILDMPWKEIPTC